VNDQIALYVALGVCAALGVWVAVKALPAIVLSDWMERKLWERAMRSRAHLDALMAARQAYSQILERAEVENGTAAEGPEKRGEFVNAGRLSEARHASA
jgi:hypothetical protein